MLTMIPMLPIDCFIILFVILSILFTTLLFYGGVKDITTELIFSHSVFYKESNGWGIKHLLTNFVFMFEFGSFPYYYYQNSKRKESKRTLYMYIYIFIMCISLVIGLYLFGEICEQLIRIIVNTITTSDWFHGYSSETPSDILLSDGTQAISPGIGAMLYIICLGIKAPSSSIISKKGGWWYVLIRISLFVIFSVLGFVGTIDKTFGTDTHYKIGYYLELCLRMTTLLILHRQCKLRDEVTVSYYVIYIFFWLVNMPLIMGLKFWDLITSNVAMITLFLVLLFLKFYEPCK